MIGPFQLDAPAESGAVADTLDQASSRGIPYAAIVLFGLPEGDDDPELRLAAGYRHLAEHPDDGPIWLEVVRLHAEAGRIDAALAILAELDRLEAPGLYPGTYLEDIAVHRAHLLADAGRFDDLEPLLIELGDTYGDAVQYHHLRASVLHERERFEEAARAYDDALAALEAVERGGDDDEDDPEADLAALRALLEQLQADAEAGEAFNGRRSLSLADLAAQQPWPED